MRVSIPDDLHETLVSQLRGNQTLEAEIARRLQATEHLAGGEHFLVLNGHQLDQLAKALGRALTPRSFVELLAYAERRSAITFGGIALDFSVGQIEELQRLASREGQTLEEYCARVAKGFTSQFFRVSPARDEWPGVTTREVEIERVPMPQEAGVSAPTAPVPPSPASTGAPTRG